MLLLVFEWTLDRLDVVEVKINLLLRRKVTGKDVFGFVNGNALFQTGILVPGISDFEFSSNLPPVVEDNVRSSSPEWICPSRAFAQILAQR
jgi:hypothetical protein